MLPRSVSASPRASRSTRFRRERSPPPRTVVADWCGQHHVEPRAHVPRRVQCRGHRSAPDARPRGGHRHRWGWPMKKGAAILAVVIVVGVSVAVAAALRRDTGSSSLPTALAARTTFVDFLQLRGEIRPVRSIVLTAPSSGTDLQIVELATNGAKVAAGDAVVTFDPTVQQRTLETKQSELKQAESEIERTEAEQRRRVASAQSELDEAKKALERARLELQGNELRARIDAEKFVIAVSDAEEHVRELEKKVEGERMAAQADVAIARQKRDKAQFDVRETERIIASLQVRAPIAGSI